MDRFVTTPEERFVLGALAHPDHRDLEALAREHRALPDEDALFDCAKRNRVASTVGSRLRTLLGGRIAPRWQDEIDRVERHNTVCFAELDRVAALLRREGIALVALKNSGIARGLYPRFAECPMGDIDVLVDKARFREAHALLEADGYRLGFQSAQPVHAAELEVSFREGGTEYLKELAPDVTLVFELQWRPVAGRWIRPDQEPSGADLVQRSVPIDGTDVRLLAPLDNLLQVSLHTAKHTYVRAPGVRLHTDVDRLAWCAPPDWDDFAAAVERMEATTAVYLSLAFAKALLGSPVPDRTVERLRPSGAKLELLLRMLRRAGLFDPDRPKFTKPEYVLFNALLYDDLDGLRRGVFPAWSWMREHYGLRHPGQLPYYYGKRLLDLALRRAART